MSAAEPATYDELHAEIGRLRGELAAVTANRDAWCERAGELLTEANNGGR